MDFSVTPLRLQSDSLEMEYFLVGWDSEILQRPVAQISRIELRGEKRTGVSFKPFQAWLDAEQVYLCCCRLAHDRVAESLFLQERGFRFIELNYRPILRGLQRLEQPGGGIEIVAAGPEDEEELAAIAGSIFRHGRFHQDPRLGSEIGNRRYEVWMRNSFRYSQQTTYKCQLDGRTVAFFVVEYPAEDRAFWSLIGLSPGLPGRGWGTRVWQAMARYHQSRGIDTIETSISSHNASVLNLYVKLGFRFPRPRATFHWVRQ